MQCNYSVPSVITAGSRTIQFSLQNMIYLQKPCCMIWLEKIWLHIFNHILHRICCFEILRHRMKISVFFSDHIEQRRVGSVNMRMKIIRTSRFLALLIKRLKNSVLRLFSYAVRNYSGRGRILSRSQLEPCPVHLKECHYYKHQNSCDMTLPRIYNEGFEPHLWQDADIGGALCISLRLTSSIAGVQKNVTNYMKF